MINFEALFKISYGLYIVCSGDQNSGNGFISNTVFQVTSDPPRFAACCNKNNYTAEFVEKYRVFSVSALSVNAPASLFGSFGYQSGRDIDKLSGVTVKYGETGVPIVLDDAIALFEFRLIQTVDLGSHLMFVGELVNAETTGDEADPMTYQYYRQIRKGLSPKNAPTYIDKSKLEKKIDEKNKIIHKCAACGFIYDDSVENIKFGDLPDDWVCPVCGSEKVDFIVI